MWLSYLQNVPEHDWSMSKVVPFYSYVIISTILVNTEKHQLVVLPFSFEAKYSWFRHGYLTIFIPLQIVSTLVETDKKC